MLDTRDFADLLLAKTGFFAGVPDSLLKDLNACLADIVPEGGHWISANEGSAVGMACGHFMATGRPGVVFMQNSGLGHALNPLVSLCDPLVYGIPVLLLVGLRGEAGKHDEPQHRKKGLITEALLTASGIATFLLPEETEEARETVAAAFNLMEAERRPAAIIIRKGTFSPYSGAAQIQRADLPTREAALEAVLKFLPPAGRIVSTTGMLSRELFEFRERDGHTHDNDFLTVGAMGHASQIAFGLAVGLPNVKIFCLDGDGALLMHMGGLASIGTAGLRNYTHIVFNNAAHDSVGGQSTVAGELDLPQIALSCGYTEAARVDNLAGIGDRLARYAQEPGCFFLEIRVAKGARKDLGRPGLPLPDCLEAFSKSCRLLEP